MDTPDRSRPLDHSRQVTIDALCEHFANDVMDVEEFERRVEATHRAATTDELKELLRDLPGGDLPATTGFAANAPMASPSRGVARPEDVRERGWAVAVMGGSTRKGRWSPARINHAVAVMGGTELDFREALMPPGVTEVQVFALWGGVDIVVPPGMRVETHGVGIMGGFDHAEDSPVQVAPDAPVLRLSGVAIMGGVSVTARYPGESTRQAKKRVRQERKDRRLSP